MLYHCAVDVHFVNYEDRRLTELDDAVWDRMMRLCLTGAFYLCKHVGRQMLAQRSGSIILSATTDALIGVAGLDSYTAAKGGIVSLTRSFAAGMAPDGVRVNTLCPAFVSTEPQMDWLDVPESRAAIQSLHLLPIPEPEDIAPFAVFLASDESRSVTGGIFPVDSGYMAFKANGRHDGRHAARTSGTRRERASDGGFAPRAYACRTMRETMRTGADRTLELLERRSAGRSPRSRRRSQSSTSTAWRRTCVASSRTRTRTGSHSGPTRRRTSRPRSACASSSSGPAV